MELARSGAVLSAIDAAGASGFELLTELGLADVDVVVGEGALEEGGPEIVDGVAGGHGEHAFILEAAGGGDILRSKVKRTSPTALRRRAMSVSSP